MSHKIQVIGHLSTDPTAKTVGQGHVINGNIAVNDYAGREQPKKVTWFAFEAWGDHFKNLFPYMGKGDLYRIEAKLVSDDTGNPPQWTDKNGVTRSSFRLRVIELEPLGSKNRNTEPSEPQAFVDEPEDEDMPF
jgi:single-stranded DNA-binding protein